MLSLDVAGPMEVGHGGKRFFVVGTFTVGQEISPEEETSETKGEEKLELGSEEAEHGDRVDAFKEVDRAEEIYSE